MTLCKVVFLTLIISTGVLGQTPTEILGSGDRGLVFSEGWTGMPPHTAILALDPNPPLGEGTPGYIPGKTSILFQDVLSPEEVGQIPAKWWTGSQFNVFSFDDHSVFRRGSLFRIVSNHIRIYPGASQVTARKEFGFSESEIYLGLVSGFRFYWVKNDPRHVYFYKSGEQPRVVHYFTLKKGVREPLGMSRGNPVGDLALQVVSIPRGWSQSPRIIEWITLNFKDAKVVN